MPKFKYEKGGVSVPLSDPTVIELPARLIRVRFNGLLFETDKAFLLPGAMTGIRGLVDFHSAHPDMAIVVTGHSDRVGQASYNLGLSDERAAAVAHYLQDEADEWMQWYGFRPFSQTWGTREDQFMLASIRSASTGLPYYSNGIDGVFGSGTNNAFKRFQEDQGLTATGYPNNDTRRVLIGEYMALDGTTLPQEARVELLGCGEHHNAVPTADHVEEQANRRVEVFCFDDGEIEPPVPEQCPDAGCPYHTWLEETVDTIDFHTGLGELVVGVVEHEENGPELTPIDGASVRLTREGFEPQTLSTPSNGIVHFTNVVPGTYTLIAAKESFEDDSQFVEIVPGGTAVPFEASEGGDQNNTSQFAGDGSSGGDTKFFGTSGNPAPTGGNKPVKSKLKSHATIIHIVEELPSNLNSVVKEGVAQSGREAFERVNVYPRWETSPRPVIVEFPVEPDGKTVIESKDAPQDSGILTAVKTKGPHVAPIIYTMRDPADSTKILTAPPVQRGQTTQVNVSARSRLSVWAFGAPLLKSTFNGITLDGKLVTKMYEARIDDLTLNYCLAPDSAKNWSGSGSNLKVLDQKVTFTGRLAPGGLKSNAEPYIKEVVKQLHSKGIQVLLGYTVGSDGPTQTLATTKFNKDFAAWLLAMTDDQIDEHAKQIDAFVGRMGADGVGFDFETDELTFGHRDKLQRLIRSTAVWVGRSNGVVSYATAPFTEDGKKTAISTLGNSFQGISIQPYALAKMEKNLIARPMAFAAEPIPNTNPQRFRDVSFPDFSITQSLEYALKPTDQGGVGLDPSQIQMAVFGSGLGVARTERMCREDFRPNRAGMMVYSLSQTKGIAKQNLDNCKLWEAALNPGENAPGEPGQPVQVPLWMKIPDPPKST